jgi:carbohydrate kinase (thermoresistant glucokinase family)
MGPSGVGKTHIGTLLATELAVRFVDADDLHAPEALALMSAGEPLDDAMRQPWLERVGQALAQTPSVMACSALKRSYREIIRSHAPDVFFIELDAPADVIAARIDWRDGHFMPASLLESQLATLEHLGYDENGIRIDATWRDDEIVELASAMARAGGSLD